MEPMGTDAAAGLPEELDGGRALRAVLPRPACPRRRRRAPRRAPQQPDDRLPVHSGDRDNLIQESLLLPPVGMLVSCPLSCRVFPTLARVTVPSSAAWVTVTSDPRD